MNQTQLQVLRDEINNDPEGVGYAGKKHAHIAKLLRETRRSVDRPSFTGGELFASLVLDELTALNPKQREYVTLAIQAAEIPLTNTVKKQLGGLFPKGSVTRKNLLALMRQDGTRADELGLGGVTPSDVARALQQEPKHVEIER